jgi:alkanesulfonate monooxygenase SsuD/methylene tetrahydromethanopterin reductase-like flavin-dependent oxidoreductase (luciferase family)
VSRRIRFGFCIPIFANPGMAFFRTPCYERLDWPTTRKAVLECEALGYDSLFVADHVFLGRHGAIYEGWTLLSALAGMTRRMQLSPIHLCDSFRNPALTAKQIATLDIVSEGRFILFYDYGIIKGMLTETRFSYEGRFYSVREAVCEPKAVQSPLPPIWMGEVNNPVMVEAIVSHADVFNSMPVSLEGFREKLRALDAACAQAGRDPASIGRSLETQVLVRESDSEIDACFERMERLRPAQQSDADILAQMKATNPALESYGTRADYEQEFVIGTPDQVARRLSEYADLGAGHFMLWFMDYPDLGGLRLFAREVMPRFR